MKPVEVDTTLHPFEAARAVLGSVLAYPAELAAVHERLGDTADAFLDPAHRRVYEVMVDLRRGGRGIDIAGMIDAGCDSSVLGPLCERGFKVTYLGQHLDALAADWTRRRAARAMERAGRELQRADADPGATVAALRAGLGEIGDAHAGRESITARDAAAARVAHYRRIREQPESESTIATGLRGLDRILLGGARPGELIIVAARPSVGKTALCLQAGQHAAALGTPVLFLSLEMSADAITDRLLQMRDAKPDPLALRWGADADAIIERAERAAGEIAELPLHIDDLPRMTIPQIEARVRRFVRGKQRALIAVDYLQLARLGRRAESRYAEVSEISAALKALAREAGQPIICACQLSREAEQVTDGRRLLSTLKESGGIEQDADVVIALRRLSGPEIDAMSESGWPRADAESAIECTVAKQRNGPTGVVMLQFDGARQLFRETGGETPTPRAPRPGGRSARRPAPAGRGYRNFDGGFD